MTHNRSESSRKITRRALLAGAGVAVAGVAACNIARKPSAQPKCPVFIARNQTYTGPLARTIGDGLRNVGFDREWVRGRRVVLKPNMVEPTRESPQMTTHPAMVVAAAEVFRGWGAEVVVGEAPGHVRDTEMALAESGIGDALTSERLEFHDLNYCPSQAVTNAGKVSWIEEFRFPTVIVEADLIVSMPKLKTHHWVGVTASMKNLYGTLPGLVYGWPKNKLHYAGISKTVVDINASLPQRIGIVDGILCMEGDGPIMGTPKPMGIVAVSLNPTALDATLARVAGFAPEHMSYLQLSADRLGPVDDALIVQRGEPWQELYSPFEIIDQPHLKRMLDPDRTS